MLQMKYQKISTWDVAYAADMAIACLITYWVVAFLLPNLAGRPSTSVGILWAVISTVFVYKDTRSHSLSAGISRLIENSRRFILSLRCRCGDVGDGGLKGRALVRRERPDCIAETK